MASYRGYRVGRTLRDGLTGAQRDKLRNQGALSPSPNTRLHWAGQELLGVRIERCLGQRGGSDLWLCRMLACGHEQTHTTQSLRFTQLHGRVVVCKTCGRGSGRRAWLAGIDSGHALRNP